MHLRSPTGSGSGNWWDRRSVKELGLMAKLGTISTPTIKPASSGEDWFTQTPLA